ncbi:MAG: DUF1329 domain-containing protein [Candidatus Binatia bacterium]
MTTPRSFVGVATVAVLLGWASAYAVAAPPLTTELAEKYGLKPGMKITKENADLIKELVPEAVYNHTKNGDYSFIIGKFPEPDTLAPAKLWDKEYLASTENNRGKYDVDEDGGIIDKATKERPWPMPLGLPYPDLDLNEPPAKVGAKIAWNLVSLAGACGEQDHEGARIVSAPREGAYDRYVGIKALRQYIDFRRNPTNLVRPVIFQEIFFFNEPSDAFGTSNLTWRWADPKKWDSVWGYSPSTRRVKRSTAANRSDATLGTEFTQDDGTPMYNGKVEMMNWKYVGTGVHLIPVSRGEKQAEDDFTAYITYDAAHSNSPSYSSVPTAYEQRYKNVTFGYQENPQQHVSWWTPNMLWVPVPVYFVEAEPKDPYYNYGRQIYSIEQNSYAPVFKQIYNRSGEYWRTGTLWAEFPRFKHDGKEYVCFDGVGTVIGDEKLNRGTAGLDNGNIPLGKEGGPTVHYNTGRSGDIFQLEQFLQYGK